MKKNLKVVRNNASSRVGRKAVAFLFCLLSFGCSENSSDSAGSGGTPSAGASGATGGSSDCRPLDLEQREWIVRSRTPQDSNAEPWSKISSNIYSDSWQTILAVSLDPSSPAYGRYFSADDGRLRSAVGLPGDVVDVIASGNIRNEKDVDVLVRTDFISYIYSVGPDSRWEPVQEIGPSLVEAWTPRARIIEDLDGDGREEVLLSFYDEPVGSDVGKRAYLTVVSVGADQVVKMQYVDHDIQAGSDSSSVEWLLTTTRSAQGSNSTKKEVVVATFRGTPHDGVVAKLCLFALDESRTLVAVDECKDFSLPAEISEPLFYANNLYIPLGLKDITGDQVDDLLFLGTHGTLVIPGTDGGSYSPDTRSFYASELSESAFLRKSWDSRSRDVDGNGTLDMISRGNFFSLWLNEGTDTSPKWRGVVPLPDRVVRCDNGDGTGIDLAYRFPSKSCTELVDDVQANGDTGQVTWPESTSIENIDTCYTANADDEKAFYRQSYSYCFTFSNVENQYYGCKETDYHLPLPSSQCVAYIDWKFQGCKDAFLSFDTCLSQIPGVFEGDCTCTNNDGVFSGSCDTYFQKCPAEYNSLKECVGGAFATSLTTLHLPDGL